MASNLDKYRADLKRLTELGDTLDADLTLRSLDSVGELDDDHKILAKEISGSFEKALPRLVHGSYS
ncbi:MAG: hypothetical protein R3E53_08990 [Myxococcota bacterium]